MTGSQTLILTSTFYIKTQAIMERASWIILHFSFLPFATNNIAVICKLCSTTLFSAYLRTQAVFQQTTPQKECVCFIQNCCFICVVLLNTPLLTKINTLLLTNDCWAYRDKSAGGVNLRNSTLSVWIDISPYSSLTITSIIC